MEFKCLYSVQCALYTVQNTMYTSDAGVRAPPRREDVPPVVPRAGGTWAGLLWGRGIVGGGDVPVLWCVVMYLYCGNVVM